MGLADFDYELPVDRIAQEPVHPRDGARLLVHDVGLGGTRHLTVRDLPDVLEPGDLLVVNDTRVRAARLCGTRRTGGAVELLLLEEDEGGRWRALARPAAKLRDGEPLELEGGALVAYPRERSPSGEWWLELEDPARTGAPIAELVELHGRMPLPPYVKRPRGEDPRRELDRASYQTMFARNVGAVAAPTAGLHFTPDLAARLERREIELARVTLHVGEGTFRPVEVDDVEKHVMHSERWILPATTVEAIGRCRERGRRVVAVGTTSARVLETAGAAGELRAGSGETRLFLRPGSEFRVVDALFTNFHLPRSTLLMLVSAFAGRERILGLYAEAIERGYRFFSYGDAMLLDRGPRQRRQSPASS